MSWEGLKRDIARGKKIFASGGRQVRDIDFACPAAMLAVGADLFLILLD
jgi:hypothetical protein